MEMALSLVTMHLKVLDLNVENASCPFGCCRVVDDVINIFRPLTPLLSEYHVPLNLIGTFNSDEDALFAEAFPRS